MRTLPQQWKTHVSRFMQLILLGITVFGVYTTNLEIVFTGVFSLLITFLPAFMEWNYRIPLNPALTAWLTFFVLLHAIGGFGPYDTVWWWDDLLHTFISAIVAGIGFTAVRVIDRYSDNIHIPHRFMFVFLLLFIMAAGVLWEIFEYGIEYLAHAWNLGEPIVQYSLEDTVTDLMYNTFGGFLVAAGGHAYFNSTVEAIAALRDQPPPS